MANVKSAQKRVKTNKKSELRNRAAKSTLRTALKKINAALEGNNPEVVQQCLPTALSTIGKSLRKGLIHKNKAARQTSRLMKKVNKVAAASK